MGYLRFGASLDAGIPAGLDERRGDIRQSNAPGDEGSLLSAMSIRPSQLLPEDKPISMRDHRQNQAAKQRLHAAMNEQRKNRVMQRAVSYRPGGTDGDMAGAGRCARNDGRAGIGKLLGCKKDGSCSERSAAGSLRAIMSRR